MVYLPLKISKAKESRLRGAVPYLYIILGVLVLVVLGEAAFFIAGRNREQTPVASINEERDIPETGIVDVGGSKTLNRDKLEARLGVLDPSSGLYIHAPFVQGMSITVMYSGIVGEIGLYEPGNDENLRNIAILLDDGQGNLAKHVFSDDEIADSEVIGVAGFSDIKKGDAIEITAVTNLLDSAEKDKITFEVRR